MIQFDGWVAKNHQRVICWKTFPKKRASCWVGVIEWLTVILPTWWISREGASWCVFFGEPWNCQNNSDVLCWCFLLFSLVHLKNHWTLRFWRVWMCFLPRVLLDLRTTSFEIPWFLGQHRKTQLINLSCGKWCLTCLTCSNRQTNKVRTTCWKVSNVNMIGSGQITTTSTEVTLNAGSGSGNPPKIT